MTRRGQSSRVWLPVDLHCVQRGHLADADTAAPEPPSALLCGRQSVT